MARTLRHGLALFLVFGFLTSVARAEEPTADRRPNILWLIAEDMGPQLGCYGTPQVWSPNLDRLAEQGMRYTHAFATAPVCSASRSAFMTGMYQTTIGAHNHRSHRDDGYKLPQGAELLTTRLQRAGYYTANVREIEPGLRGTGKTDWNFAPPRKAFDSDKWSDLKSHQPFYAQINFPETHRGHEWNTAHKELARRADPEKVELPPYYPDHPVARADWAQYLNTVMALDKKIGRVLKKLDEEGLAENTIVIFFGDHGQAHVRGKQWCYDSGLHIPLVLRWPKGMEAPRGYEAGTVSDQLLSAIDLTATTLALAGVEKPEPMQGRVFLGEASEPARQYVFAARDRCDETVFRIRTVRDGRYRYIRNYYPERPFLQTNRYKESTYPMLPLMRRLHQQGKLTPVQEVLFAPQRPAEELYDTQADPHEIHNLAGSAEQEATRQRMRAALDQWIEESNDQGATPEPQAIVEHWDKAARERYKNRPRAKVPSSQP